MNLALVALEPPVEGARGRPWTRSRFSDHWTVSVPTSQSHVPMCGGVQRESQPFFTAPGQVFGARPLHGDGDLSRHQPGELDGSAEAQRSAQYNVPPMTGGG